MSILARFLPEAATGDPLAVVPLRRRHLPSVLEIESASHPKPWSEGIFRSELELAAAGERHYIAALDGRVVVGYAGLMFVIDEAHVTNIAAAPARRRVGLGSRLLAELIGEARRRACVAMTLEVRASNVGAQALYRSFGFIPAGIRQRYYENTEDAIVMWCHDLANDDYPDVVAERCPQASWLRAAGRPG